MSTTSSETGHYTCLYYNGAIHHGLNEENKEYWTSPQGITTRIDSIAQVFTYGIFNNAVKILGTTKGAKWLEWITMGDDRVCPTCLDNASKGDNGFFKSGWFTPQMPAHPGCRCMWRVYWER